MSAAASTRNTFIVFGAHPDDIEIGMAGTICRLASEGHDVYSCIATIPDDRERRVREAEEAAALLGIKEVILLPLKADQLGYNRATIGAIDSIIKTLKPHSVFTHWLEDSHQDHVNITRCVIAATRKNDFNVYMYEQTIPGGITPAAFRAQYVIDVSAFIDRKMKSIQAHASQLMRNGDWWVEGIRGRAMYRGYQIRAQYAEAFEIIKIKNDTGLFLSQQRADDANTTLPLDAQLGALIPPQVPSPAHLQRVM
jgi:LmbE family N-acetylglucosaminyl deacetylase